MITFFFLFKRFFCQALPIEKGGLPWQNFEEGKTVKDGIGAKTVPIIRQKRTLSSLTPYLNMGLCVRSARKRSP
jgi:hypothetical protein